MSRLRPNLPKNRPPASLPTRDSSSSFWHSAPSPLLVGHRTTRNLPATADVVIIGNGITGASVAHHLLSRPSPDKGTSSISSGDAASPRLDVVMLEAREACWGATGRNGGHCQPLLFEHPHDPSVGLFELANFHAIQDLVRAKDIAEAEFVVQPGVRAIYSRHHLDDAETSLAILKTTSPMLSSMMRLVTDPDELATLRIPTARGAIVTSVAARMWPYKFVSRILADLLTDPNLPGGTFNLQTLTPVTALIPAPSSSPGGWLVQTPRASITARHVVLATNAYTSHLLPSFSDLIVPCRGQMSALEPLPAVAGENRLKTSLGFLGDGLDDYLIQRPNDKGGHLMFGGGRALGATVGETDDTVVDADTAQYLRTRLVEALALESEEREFHAPYNWSGIMGFSRDGHPWVGPVPGRRGLSIAAGFTGHGMPNTWLCGKAVARMVANAVSDEDDEDGAVDRACAEVGLPRCYRCTRERMEDASRREWRDWTEDVRERASTEISERLPSGYA